MEQADLSAEAIKIITTTLNNPSLPKIPMAYFYGGSELGLSDFIINLTGEINSISWSTKIYHQKARVFMNQVIEAISDNKLRSFNDHLLSQDVVILEDLEYLCCKTRSISFLGHLIEDLKEKDKLFVATGKDHPLELFPEEDLGGKLMQGFVMLGPRTNESVRYELIQEQTKTYKVELNEEILKYIAKECTNLGLLEAAVNVSINYSKINSKPIKLKVLKDMIRLNSE